MFSCEIFEICKNKVFYGTPPVAASDDSVPWEYHILNCVFSGTAYPLETEHTLNVLDILRTSYVRSVHLLYQGVFYDQTKYT